MCPISMEHEHEVRVFPRNRQFPLWLSIMGNVVGFTCARSGRREPSILHAREIALLKHIFSIVL